MQQTMQTTQTIDPVRRWDRLSLDERFHWMGDAADGEIWDLAVAVGCAGWRTPAEVLGAWVQFGYISTERAERIATHGPQ